MQTDDIAVTAAGLTKAQRACLELTAEASIIDIVLFAPNGSILVGDLRNIGIVGGLGDATTLTPLGIAVRSHIKE